MAWVNAFGPLAFVAAAAALPWLFNPHSSLCASWLEDWDGMIFHLLSLRKQLELSQELYPHN